MAVSAEVSTVSAIAGSPGRSRSKRPTSSAAKCWQSAAEPPLPQASTLLPRPSAAASASPARAMAGRQRFAHALLERDGVLEVAADVGDVIHGFGVRLVSGVGIVVLARRRRRRGSRPARLRALDRKDIEAARGFRPQPREVVSGRGDDAPLLALRRRCRRRRRRRSRTARAPPRTRASRRRARRGRSRRTGCGSCAPRSRGPGPRGSARRAPPPPRRGGGRRRAPPGSLRGAAAGPRRPASKTAGTRVRAKCRSASSVMRPVTPSSERVFASALQEHAAQAVGVDAEGVEALLLDGHGGLRGRVDHDGGMVGLHEPGHVHVTHTLQVHVDRWRRRADRRRATWCRWAACRRCTGAPRAWRPGRARGRPCRAFDGGDPLLDDGRLVRAAGEDRRAALPRRRGPIRARTPRPRGARAARARRSRWPSATRR